MAPRGEKCVRKGEVLPMQQAPCAHLLLLSLRSEFRASGEALDVWAESLLPGNTDDRWPLFSSVALDPELAIKKKNL